MKTHTFHINGMHCESCVHLTESEVREHERVRSAKSSLEHRTIEIEGDFENMSMEEIAEELTKLLSRHGYSLSVERRVHTVKWQEFRWALPLAAVFIALFILLQKAGVVNLINTSQIGFGAAFLIGLVASVSTCMAVVGGLVLSMSASFAKEGDKIRPQVLFHVGRLASFFLLGGAIGILGSAFQLGTRSIFVLGLIVALVLIILGLNLLDILPQFRRLQPTMPKFFNRHVHGLKNINHIFVPILVGAATFFLPCGFTQSMQIYTLTTGSFAVGALTMLSFALGTLPVLVLLSFSFLSIRKRAQSGIFFKTAGLVVIFFGLLNLAGSLVAIGLVPPIFNL